jgi:nicotinate-nucleotide pyrophosphorylase (carboxylating)
MIGRIDKESMLKIVKDALREDIGKGDVTSEALLSKESSADARLVAREEGIIAGLVVAEAVFHTIDPKVSFEYVCGDGDHVHAGEECARVSGAARAILGGERVALNFLQRLSGIATLTGKFVRAVEGTGARIYDTRKTTPLLRVLEKYAVRCAGGFNHRMGLFDQVLIKDNHIQAAKREGLRSLSDMIQKVRSRSPKGTIIEIEVEMLEDFKDALAGTPDIIMLDNMTVEEMKRAREGVKDLSTRPLLEASGSISLENVADVAAAGVDIISVGALTHSAGALDISLEFE